MTDTEFVWLFVAIIVVYVLPTLIAIIRWHPQFWAILVVNLLLGWTLIGWVGALVLSVWNFAPRRP